MVALYVNSRIVCGFFLSWLGGSPQSFERSIWDCVGFYTIHTFLDPLVESQFRIISKSYNFLFGTRWIIFLDDRCLLIRLRYNYSTTL